MYSKQTSSMTISVPLFMWQRKTSVTVLLDSGATHNFVDSRTVAQLHLGTRPLKQPLSASNIDGTLNKAGTITHFCNLTVRTENHSQTLSFYVANIGSDRMIFGHPWFKVFNPVINWATNTLSNDYSMATAGYQTQQKCERTNIRTITTSKPSIDPSIPEEYHRHWEVFDEVAAKRFPPARNEDHVITLKDGAPDVLDCKVYRQTAAEEEATRTFIKEHLNKGYITPSNSPYASPLFYRKKKDGSLRPIMDYRVLNLWTIRDVYPLPLISTILDHLQGKSIFTKFDIRWGYENI
jgi:hypothetical protein